MSYEVDYISWLQRQKERLTFKYNKMKAERDTLIDDLPWYKAKVSRLEREKENLKQSVSEYKDYAESHVANYLELKALEHENKALRLQSDTYFEQWQQHKALNNEISQHIGNKPSSSTYKYFREKLDGIGIKEGE